MSKLNRLCILNTASVILIQTNSQWLLVTQAKPQLCRKGN